MKPKDKGEHDKKYLSYFIQCCEFLVLLDKVNQAEKQKELQNFARVKVETKVSLFERLNVQ